MNTATARIQTDVSPQFTLVLPPGCRVELPDRGVLLTLPTAGTTDAIQAGYYDAEATWEDAECL